MREFYLVVDGPPLNVLHEGKLEGKLELTPEAIPGCLAMLILPHTSTAGLGKDNLAVLYSTTAFLSN